MRTVFSFALGAAAGAATVQFLNSRDKAREFAGSVQSTASSTVSAAQTRAHHATNQMKGVVHAVTPHTHEEMDDATLADRVRSEIFRASDAPKGSVVVDVQAGVAYLRGEVPDRYWIDRLGTSTGKVEGITGVKNLLHSPGTPAPPAEPRFLASEHFHRR
jgi:osmotically-inducible protein OsmY